MKLRAIAAVTGTVFVLGGSLVGCSSGSSTPSATPTTTVTTTATPTSTAIPTDYNAEIESTFVGACVTAAKTNGTSEADASAICGCTYRGIAKKIPFKDYVAADQDAQKGSPVPKAFTDIRDECNADPNAY